MTEIRGFLAAFFLTAAVGCGGSDHSNSGLDNGGSGGTISFAQDIQPIFNNRCTSCHNATAARGGLDLSGPDSYSHLVNAATSTSCNNLVPGVVRVKPGDTAGSMLWRKTKPDPSRCSAPMPFSSNGLGEIAPAEFAKLEKWIQQGALNN